jgi:hypothetical protein
MTEYRVTWKIDIEADSPEEAAEKALAVHRDPNSIATVFEVTFPCDSPTWPAPRKIVKTIDLNPEHSIDDW